MNFICYPGLPRGWTLPKQGAVSKAQFRNLFPCHKRLEAWMLTECFEVILLSAKAAQASGKLLPMISLFSGVGGLELGLGEWGSY